MTKQACGQMPIPTDPSGMLQSLFQLVPMARVDFKVCKNYRQVGVSVHVTNSLTLEQIPPPVRTLRVCPAIPPFSR
jgi:hypothetical protein